MKVGVLINQGKLTRFYAKLILELNVISNIEIVLLELKQNSSPKKSFMKSLWYSYVPFSIFMKFEKRLLKIKEYPLDYVDCPLSDKVPKLTFDNLRESPYSELSNSDIARISQEKFDVLLRVGWGIIKGELLNVPKFGIWSLHHGDNDNYRGKPALFWEYYHSNEIVGAILQRLTDKLDGGEIIDRLTTNVNKYYITNGYYQVYYKSLDLIIDNIEYLMNNGHLRKFDCISKFYTKKIYRSPNVLKQLYLIIKLILSNIVRVLNKVRKFSWFIYIVKSSNKELLYKYKPLMNNKGYFSADPFLFDCNGSTFLFFEEASLKSGIGHISYTNLNDQTQKGIALKEDFHLSFPNVFSDGEDIFMIPETRNSNSISLYKCIEFPDKWEKSKTLLNNLSAVDSEIVKIDDTYYLFTSISRTKYVVNSDNLYLYYSDSLNNEFIPHQCNPISRDARYSRMGGKVFFENGKYYRVSQNQSKGYGSGINILEIVTISKFEYKEVLVQSVMANSISKKGLHTYNFNSNYSVIDIRE